MLKKSLIFVFFLISLVALSFLSIFVFQKDFQLKDLRFKYLSFQYDKYSSLFPAGDYRALRYGAMSEALKKGKLDYQFESGPLPVAK